LRHVRVLARRARADGEDEKLGHGRSGKKQINNGRISVAV
jgi:hypothetical protein